MKLRYMNVSPGEVIVRFDIEDLADIYYVYVEHAQDSHHLELAEAIRDVVFDSIGVVLRDSND